MNLEQMHLYERGLSACTSCVCLRSIFGNGFICFVFLLKVRFPNIMYDRDTTHDDLIEYDELLQIELPFLAYCSEI